MSQKELKKLSPSPDLKSRNSKKQNIFNLLDSKMKSKDEVDDLLDDLIEDNG